MDLWEPVNGVFWSAPPDDGWVHWPIAIVLLFAIITVAGLAVRIVKKRSEPEWHLRQHMVELGGAATLIYLVGIAALTGDRIGTLGDMPLNEVGDFLAGAFGPVGFLWLVLGFLQQGEELKESLQQQSIMARAAHRQTEVLTLERERLLTAIFSLETSPRVIIVDDRYARNVIEVQNGGNIAVGAALIFEPPINDLERKELGDFLKDSTSRDDLEFSLVEGKAAGDCRLEYTDAVGGRRAEFFKYSVDRDRVSFMKVYR
ncbi:hypothetical protein PAGU2196_23180 [Pseudomonas sp. PAGU 2196]|uniref:hypothetical protein n=1 Tax=Pseudomonas sp. PAGU 2196 TaxID=2793997 RepID=UPI001EE05DD8|nr:hypothetical protein [Pseudomonas sp. PAGU 2196]GHS81484.1 hypothetical protein PAGU2196_23180 [Pseudomonas sp. PAGU 2196]